MIKTVFESLINNSRTAWPTKIPMTFLRFSGNLIQGAYIFALKRANSLKYCTKQRGTGLQLLFYVSVNIFMLKEHSLAALIYTQRSDHS